jgi:hypothetical protein
MIKIQRAVLTLLMCGLGLLGACVATDAPGEDVQPTTNAEIAVQVCGGCMQDEPPTIGDDGTVYSCSSCEVAIDETVEQTVESGVLSLTEEPPNKTELECDLAYATDVGKCRASREHRSNKCWDAYNATVASCYLEVNRKCGTSSPFHECVIKGRQQCRADAVPALDACQRLVEIAYVKCMVVAKTVWETCVNNAGKVLRHLPGWLKSHSPF